MVRTVQVTLRSGKTAELTQPERSDFSSNLGGAVQYALANVIVWIAETSGEALGSFGGSALVSFLEHIEPGLVKYYAPLIDELLNVPELPQVLRTFLTELKSPTSEAGAALLDTVAGGAVSSVTSSLFGALTAEWTYAVNRAIQGARPGVVDALVMAWRMPEMRETVRGWLLDQGWSDQQIAAFYETIQPRVPPGELVTWAWRVTRDPMTAWSELEKRGYNADEVARIVELSRNLPSVPDLLNWSWRVNLDPTAIRDEIIAHGYGETDADRFIELSKQRLSVSDLVAWAWRTEREPETVRDEIIAQGYPEAQADRLLELAHFIPPVADLIRMAVREAWRDDVAGQYGYDEDFPTEFAEWTKKQGMTEEWAKRYWRAHWELPGPVMAREMLHRTSMTIEDYETLLRIADYPRAFRDWMVEVAYTPYTRVDVRRMHALGVLSDGDLVRAYMDLGYNTEKAAAMAQFTIRLNVEEETEFTASNILAGYRAGMLDKNEATELLVALGKSANYAAYVLTLEDFKREQSLLTEKVNAVKTLYTNWEISVAEAISRLAALNLEAERIDRFLETWTVSREAKVARPTIAQIEEWYKDSILDEAQARAEISKRKYQDYMINWMIADWDQQIVDAARKEAERAQKEQERVAKAEFRTKRAQALANLNAQIAEARLYIAELKLAMYATITIEQKDDIKKTITATQVEIAELQLEKARIPITI